MSGADPFWGSSFVFGARILGRDPIQKGMRRIAAWPINLKSDFMSAAITTLLTDIEENIDTAAEQLKNDAGASPVLKAVFDELHRKARAARDGVRGADENSIREQLIEVEQAADSAKLAAKADERISASTREAVLAIHDALCAMKAELVH